MLVLKTVDRKGNVAFWEVHKTARPQFDHGREWVLVSTPVGARPRKMDLRWLMPSPDLLFVWVREFQRHDPTPTMTPSNERENP